MKKVLYLDCCIRENDSRTKLIADAFFEELHKKSDFSVDKLVIDQLDIVPIGSKEYKHRQNLLEVRNLDDKMFDLAKQFAQVDIVVVAAPFWDMSFPSKLKVYFENITVEGLTFKSSEDGNIVGNCKASKFIFLTTRGMDIEDGSVMEQGAPYLNAIRLFYGIDEFEMVSTFGLDVHPDEVEVRLNKAIEQAKQIAKNL